MRTPVYVKMDAQEQLLLSEGVCSQLGLVTYHPEVSGTNSHTPLPVIEDKSDHAKVPMVSVQLVKSTHILPHSTTSVKVRVMTESPYPRQFLVEGDQNLESTFGVQLADALLEPSEDGNASVLLSNPTGFTRSIDKGITVGTVSEVTVVDPATSPKDHAASVCRMSTSPHSEELTAPTTLKKDEMRETELLKAIQLPELPEAENEKLQSFLMKHHLAFCLEPGERGETDLLQFEIDTADSTIQPFNQPTESTIHCST